MAQQNRSPANRPGELRGSFTGWVGPRLSESVESQPVTFRLHGPWKICRPCYVWLFKVRLCSIRNTNELLKEPDGGFLGSSSAMCDGSTPVSIFQPDILQLAGCSMMLSCILAREAVRLHYLGIQCGRSLRLAPSTELIAADCSMAARNLLCPCQRHLPARFGAPCANARLECELPITSGAALAGGARGEER